MGYHGGINTPLQLKMFFSPLEVLIFTLEDGLYIMVLCAALIEDVEQKGVN